MRQIELGTDRRRRRQPDRRDPSHRRRARRRIRVRRRRARHRPGARPRLRGPPRPAEDRAYGDWREMLAGESARTRPHRSRHRRHPEQHPPRDHQGIPRGAASTCSARSRSTTTVEDAEDIVETARETGRICAVNFGYSGYALVRHARAMVARGDLGRIRVVVAEFAHGHHADAADADNPRVRWRYDPKLAGISSVVADAGIHALHMACFVTGGASRPSPPISLRPSPGASSRTMRCSRSACAAAPSAGSGRARSRSVACTG